MPSLVEDNPLRFLTPCVAKAFVGDADRLKDACLVIGGKPKEMV